MSNTKNISLPEYMIRYIKDSNLNLSRFVQDRLKERMISEGKYKKYKGE